MAGRLVKLGDKYDSIPAITPWASLLVTVLARSDPIHVGDALYAAWRLDAPEAFERITRRLILSPGKAKVLSGTFSDEPEIGPSDLPDGLPSTSSHGCVMKTSTDKLMQRLSVARRTSPGESSTRSSRRKRGIF